MSGGRCTKDNVVPVSDKPTNSLLKSLGVVWNSKEDLLEFKVN